ncbi:19074_t:CDS:2 [Dentiscutata erythropus]|uniref:19074_t:CDS:1 n=1 Tax=Dentiscutata erythropus TaxID=1348616 RepID=A0A9N9HVU9_9GLOM|nr:19074_t:CDS:2 [Dentiscutata erythropus]
MITFSMATDLHSIRTWLRNALEKVQYAHPDRVFRDIDATLAMFGKSLTLKTDTYTYDDGKSKALLCLHGTIPITFKSTPYNIPIDIWIPTEYPMTAPIVLVVPTSNMLVRPSKIVDVSGRCQHTYLQHWGINPQEESNIVTLCTILQGVFSQNPPVCTKPTSQPSPAPQLLHQPPTNGGQNTLKSPVLHAYHPQSPTPPPLPPPPPYQSVATNKPASRPRSRSQAAPVPPPNPRYMFPSQNHIYQQQPPSQQHSNSLPRFLSGEDSSQLVSSILDEPSPLFVPQPAPLPTTQNPELVKLQSAVYEKVKNTCNEYFEISTPEIHRIMGFGEQLNTSKERINQEREHLFNLENKIKEKTEILKNKVAEVDKLIEKVTNMPEVSVDDILCGTTIVYNQLFELVAEDNAIEDTIYYLGKALSTERIDLNTYMKNIRTLAREQFTRRALIQKIRRQTGFDKLGHR